ncbi:uncharacterized protein VTP21DRAFT_10024 [Calcarisporiella thermophila]|uniref:uncharacterized protein n=1 Tax=Calcarisporiella thermophila TaxID=911321 RepID=UPI0037444346
MSQDPLLTLRDANLNKKIIDFADSTGAPSDLQSSTQILLGETLFPRNTTTAYKKSGAKDEFYTLDSLVFLVRHGSAQDFSGYMKACIETRIPPVSIIDRKNILDYLTGVTSTNANILLTSQREKRPVDEVLEDHDAGIKKPKPAIITVSKDTIEAVKKINSRERVLVNRSTILRGNKSFLHVQKIAIEKLIKGKLRQQKEEKAHGDRGKQRPSSRSTPASEDPKSPRRRQQRTPIIIVPAAATSLVTLYNVKELLENGKFVDSQSIRDSGVKKQQQVLVQRKCSDGTIANYKIVDSVEGFAVDDWDRVVAVFVTGAAWQFRNWKWQSPVDIFHNVKGFFCQWANEDLKDVAKNWNVTTLKIHRYKRHLDKALISYFWDVLDQYTAQRNR